eukprot:scaffold114747_cov50-Attheya_sp.AAC.2
MSLVQSFHPEKIGTSCTRRRGSLVGPTFGRLVIREGEKGVCCNIHLACQDVLVCNGTGQFEVRVGDGPARILPSD